MRKFPFAFLLLLPGSLSMDVGFIRFDSVSGDPLVANENQNLRFSFSHEGAAYSCFEFVFSISKEGEKIYEKKIAYFKAPDGVEQIAFTLPGSLLESGVRLRFAAKLEHTSSSFWGDSYVCYSRKEVVATPKERGGVMFPDGGLDFYGFQSLYYPHFGMEESSFRFLGIKQDKEEKESRLHLERIRLTVDCVPEDFVFPETVGELRVYPSPDMWRIGERKKKFVALPLSLSYLGQGWFGLRLAKEYSFSPKDGTMMEAEEGLPKTRDLILPRWAEIDQKMHFGIYLDNFSEGGESLLFYKDAYPDPKAFGYGDYRVSWEEL